LPITIRARLGWDDGAFHAYTANISMTGVFVETARVVDVGTIVRLQLDLSSAGGGGSVLVSARVERLIRDDEAAGAGMLPGVGLSFRRFMMGRRSLEKFIEQRLPAVRPAPEQCSGEERRVTPRMSVGLPVVWGTSQPPKQRGWLVDLSGGGAFVLEAEGSGAEDGKIYLEFDLPVEGEVQEVRGIANVVRAVDSPEPERSGMGIRFESATVDVDLICRFVERRRAWEAGLARAAGKAEPLWPEAPNRGPEPAREAPIKKEPANRPRPAARTPRSLRSSIAVGSLNNAAVRPVFLVAFVGAVLVAALAGQIF
jgi:hypothetical protein